MDAFIQDYGYLAVLVGTFFEGETILVLGGLAAQNGHLDLRLVILAAFAGTFLGDQLYFYVGKFWGTRLLALRPTWKAPADRALGLLRRYDAAFILSYRFLYGVRSVSPFVIAMAGVSPLRFLALNLIACVIWAIGVAYLGFLLGHAIEAFLADVARYQAWVLAGVALAGLLAWGVHTARRIRRSRAAIGSASDGARRASFNEDRAP